MIDLGTIAVEVEAEVIVEQILCQINGCLEEKPDGKIFLRLIVAPQLPEAE